MWLWPGMPPLKAFLQMPVEYRHPKLSALVGRNADLII
jgi:hypothetical protein